MFKHEQHCHGENQGEQQPNTFHNGATSFLRLPSLLKLLDALLRLLYYLFHVVVNAVQNGALVNNERDNSLNIVAGSVMDVAIR